MGMFQSKVPDTVVTVPVILRYKFQLRSEAKSVAALDQTPVADEQVVPFRLLLADVTVVLSVLDDPVLRRFQTVRLLFLIRNQPLLDEPFAIVFLDFIEIRLANRTLVFHFHPLIEAFQAEFVAANDDFEVSGLVGGVADGASPDPRRPH